VKVSAIVCTKDRSDHIGGCLQALLANDYPDLRVLVVDQSGDDFTYGLVKPLAGSDDRIRYMHDDTVGLSHARNVGISRSDGDIVAFTDDDCVPSADWIDSLLAEFTANPDVDAVYGRSLPYDRPLRGERPVAVKEDSVRRIFRGKHNPWSVGHGNNMAFRRDVFAKVGLFDEAMGPGAALRNCDDADFTYRLLSAGLKAIYSPVPLVYHRQLRHGEDLWHLERDYGIGAGALYSKRIRLRDPYVLRLILDRWSRCGALHIVYGLTTCKKNHIRLGWYRVVYSILGMRLGRGFLVDESRGIFLSPGSSSYG
jgi:glycosyltransferase involved in cell wall biosynthesis